MIYTKDEKVADRALRSSYFSDLDEVGEDYELESFKPRITIGRPFQEGIAAYQLAKLRMLEFSHVPKKGGGHICIPLPFGGGGPGGATWTWWLSLQAFPEYLFD